MAWFLVPLYLLVIPYIALMLLVVYGLIRGKFKRPYSEKTPSVSVVIPAHNEEKDIGPTLASLSTQEYEGELKFYIVNDRSVDKTEEIIQSFCDKDDRFQLINVKEASRRFAPKVNAVNTGIQASNGEIIITSDSDCKYSKFWVRDIVSHFEDDVAMVVGYVETTYEPGNFVQLFETIDWFSLMTVSRALTFFGWKFASSANNQAYRRTAFEAIGGFGTAGRAPSGDEDLLTQRMGKLEDQRLVFASSKDSRVSTKTMPSVYAFMKQRQRWVSRYQHIMHYHPAFWVGVLFTGFNSIFLSLAILLTPFFPSLAPWVLGLWGVKVVVELVGMYISTGQLERRDLWGTNGYNTFRWAILHPFFIAGIVISSLVRTAEWKAGARSYRRRFYKRRVRELKRKVKEAPQELLK